MFNGLKHMFSPTDRFMTACRASTQRKAPENDTEPPDDLHELSKETDCQWVEWVDEGLGPNSRGKDVFKKVRAASRAKPVFLILIVSMSMCTHMIALGPCSTRKETPHRVPGVGVWVYLNLFRRAACLTSLQ